MLDTGALVGLISEKHDLLLIISVGPYLAAMNKRLE